MLHHLYILPILLLPFVQCISNDENAQQEKKLPNVLNAEHYTIDIKTIWDDNLKPISFEGIVTILVVTKEELDEIIINSRALELSNISVSHNEEEIYFNHTEAKKQYDGYIIRLTKIIPPNQECKISINFKGNISTGLTGFYMNKYIENGEKIYLATTQFQPLFTRRVFPCFDEPHFKSTFKLTITRPASLTPTISNMPIENSENLDDDQIKDIFHTTPKMSPYLLYFGLTRYQSSSNDSPIKIWARSRLIKNADYAINISKKSVDFMENYTGIEYFQQFDSVVMKIDSIAIPHYKYGAMENWGAITYREDYLVPDMKEITAKSKETIANIVTHEIIHQWFGNMVTCYSWDYLWLNEGFAKLFEYIILEKISPELHIMDEMPFQEVQMSFDKDRTELSEPMTVENLVSQNRIQSRFGFVSYNKACAILRMIQKTIGDDVFRTGLSTYLKSNLMGNVRPEHLYDELQKAIDDKNVLDKYETHSIADIMNTWTKTVGYPTVFVSTNYTNGTVILKQKIAGLHNNQTQPIFYIPISYTTSYDINFNNTTPNIILIKESDEIQTNLTKKDWIILNIKQEGYYRVNYDKSNWLNLGNALMKDVNIVHPINRAQIIDDVFYLAPEHGYDVVFKTTQFLEHDLDIIPWKSAVFQFNKIINECHMAETMTNLLKLHAKNLMVNFMKHLTLTERFNDTHCIKISRNKMLFFANTVGFDDIKNEAKEMFISIRNETKNIILNPNIRHFIYCMGMKDGNEDDWIFFKELISNESTPTDKRASLIKSLGCFKYNDDNIKYINHLLFEEESLRLSDKIDFLYSMLDNYNADSMFKFIKGNLLQLRDELDEESFYRILSDIPLKLKTTQLKEYESFVYDHQSYLTENLLNNIKKCIDIETNNRAQCLENEDFVTGYLKMKYNNTGEVLKIVAFILMMSTLVNCILYSFFM